MKTKEGHANASEWIPFGILLVGLFSPLFIYFGSEIAAFHALKAWMLIHGWMISAFSLFLIGCMMFYHSFSAWDELNEKQKPRFLIHCDSKDKRCADTVPYFYNDERGEAMDMILVYRLLIDIPAPNRIRNCSIYVTAITYKDIPFLTSDKIQLHFSDGDKGTVRDITNGISEHADLIQFIDGRAIIPGKWEGNDHFPFEDEGDYFITVMVTGDGETSTPKTFKFSWAGNYSEDEDAESQASLTPH